ncbi:hypothetical protein NO1_0571 [Candidatus Termititenax aidoneus]|uniref:Uncharacterized protein n=2 Tax=Termititenax aidoneus TaxID=2218524 RepID=A0A388TA87_TERA1|nr:hypothetical protein NO1_0571 [Candidatus Termititenax aidoneus]
MKDKFYLRIGKKEKGFVVKASARPIYESLSTNPYAGTPLPTVLVCLEIDIPDERFAAIELKLPEIKDAKECLEIKEVSDEKE